MDVDLYLRVREKEGRLYPDSLVAQLPSVRSNHPLKSEWQARAASAKRLLTYLAGLPKPITVLDLGCGNGWLTNRIANVAGVGAVGLDRNRVEVAQAARVFTTNSRAHWIDADIFEAPFPPHSFEIILLASSIQYFADPPHLFRALKPLMKPGGEIHIIDSPFYTAGELLAAQERTQRYYSQLGLPGAADSYHHHLLAVLDPYRADLLYDPRSWLAGLRRTTRIIDSPFPWLRLRP